MDRLQQTRSAPGKTCRLDRLHAKAPEHSQISGIHVIQPASTRFPLPPRACAWMAQLFVRNCLSVPLRVQDLLR